MKKLFGFIIILTTVLGCKEEILLPELKQGVDGEDGISTIFDFDIIPPTEINLNGGIMMMVGMDYNRNGELDTDEIQATIPIWHGNDGGFGKSPYIGENGYWYVWDEEIGDYVSSGVKAEGKDGQDGLTPNIAFINNEIPPTADHNNGGVLVMAVWDKDNNGDINDEEVIGMYTVWHGNDGQDGLTPHIGEDGSWWVGDYNTGVRAEGIDGQDGLTPYVGDNGNWWIGDYNTGVVAEGENGLTPYVGDNGNWWIGEYDTNVNAEGTDGQDGNAPYIGDDGHWYVWNKISNTYDQTNVRAVGENGDNGSNGTIVDFDFKDAGNSCDNGGYVVTVYLDGNQDYSFTICNGSNGQTVETFGCGSEGSVIFCEGNFVINHDETLVSESFNNELLPNGFTSNAGLYSFITNKLVVKVDRYGNETFVKTNTFQALELKTIKIDISEYREDYVKTITPVLISAYGNEIVLNEVVVNATWSGEERIIWDVESNQPIVQVKFIFSDDVPNDMNGGDSNHNNRKVIIDNLEIIGSEVVCGESCEDY
jgi:hypothetical protein